MNSVVQVSSNLVEKNDDSKCRFLLFSTKIISDVKFSLSLADFIRDNIQRGMITDTEVIGNVTDKRVGDDGHCSGIRYEYVRELSENRIGDVVKVSEETYWSQISKDGNDLMNAIGTFFRFVGDQMHERDDEEEMRAIRMKRMSRENELCKKEIASLMNQLKNVMGVYNDEVHVYEQERERYKEQIENAYRETNLNKIRIETENKREILLHLGNFENGLDELEQLIKEKQKKLAVSKETNAVEVDYLKRELLKKETLLKIINSRYSNDMLNRTKKKEGLQQSNESKTKSSERLKETIISMETYLRELEEEKKLYLKRELYDKLDAIRKKIALRTITKFLIPYANMKFRLRRQKARKKKTPKKNK